jgi:hypothetical protein
MLVVYNRASIDANESIEIERYYRDRWTKICDRYGLIADDRKRHDHLLYGVDVKTGQDPVRWEYMSKIKVWELAGGVTKVPRQAGSITPWDILDRAIAGDRRYQALWWDYMAAMRGRPAIRWSNGLKRLVGIGADKSDKDIAQERPGIPAYIVKPWALARIVRTESRVRVLEHIETGCLDVVDEFGLIDAIDATDLMSSGRPPNDAIDATGLTLLTHM